MPPFIVPIIQAIAAAFAVDSARGALGRHVPTPRPAPPDWSGGVVRPPAPPRARYYPIARPSVPGDRRGF